MFTVDIKSDVGQVGVETTHNRGFTPEELSVDCANKIISISQSCLLYTSPSPRDATLSRMPSSA